MLCSYCQFIISGSYDLLKKERVVNVKSSNFNHDSNIEHDWPFGSNLVKENGELI